MESIGTLLDSRIQLDRKQQLATSIVGKSASPVVRGRRLVKAGFFRSDVSGQLKTDIEAYYAANRIHQDRGACKTSCELVTQPNGLEVCKHTGQPCNRERLEALASAWGVVNEQAGVEPCLTAAALD